MEKYRDKKHIMSAKIVKFDQISFGKNIKLTPSRIPRANSSDKVGNSDGHHDASYDSGFTVVREPATCPLRWAHHKVWRRRGAESTVGEVIATSNITLLLFGSPSYVDCRQMAHRLRSMEGLPPVVYLPVYTYRETTAKVDKDFHDNHGDWWMMGFKSLGVVEAAYMCAVTVLPTVVVVDNKGVVVSNHGQRDLARWGDGAVIAWS